jgi:hypothetical protein
MLIWQWLEKRASCFGGSVTCGAKFLFIPLNHGKHEYTKHNSESFVFSRLMPAIDACVIGILA